MREKPSEFNHATKTASSISLIVLFVLSILYFLWVRFRIPLVFYVDNYREIVQFCGYILSAGYIFTMAMLAFANRFRTSTFRTLSIGLFIFTTMLCCLSANISIHLPTILDTATLKDETYYLTGELEVFDIRAYHRLYKCENTHIQCEMTPFYEGGGASFRPLSLMIDNFNGRNEINVLYTYSDGSQNLIYTYGTPDRDYDGEPVQLGNHLYYLAYHRDPESNRRTYMLFKCNLDHKGCARLPFEYQGFGRHTEIVVDEATNEIRVVFHSDFDIAEMKYVDETLIFTYGEHPRCHVEGCQILEENK